MAELLAQMGAGTAAGGNPDITIDMLDFDYVRQCRKADELRGIVDVLKSGKEGFYPELLKEAEDQLLSVLPDKERKKYLALFSTATPMEISEAEDEILNWENSITRTDNILRAKVDNASEVVPRSKARIPGVRGQSEENDTSAANVGHVNATSAKVISDVSVEKKSQRLSGYDFRAWEKYDVDSAVSAIDEEEKKQEEKMKRNAEEYNEFRDENARKRMQLHDREMEKLRSLLEADTMTPTEMRLRSIREKEKGNECFKAMEYEEAIRNYSKSICLAPDNAVIYCNRALVYLKQNKLQAAEDDCTMAIERDDKYLKAWTRRGTTRFRMGKYAQSIEDLRRAKTLDPENVEILGLLKKSEEKYLEVEGKHYSEDRIGAGSQCSVSIGSKVSVDLSESTTLEKFFTQVGELSLRNLKVTKGVCSAKYSEIRTSEVHSVDSSSNRNFIPSDNYSGSKTGYVYKKGSHGLGYYIDESPQKQVKEGKDQSIKFTRVAITDDDDDEEEEPQAKSEISENMSGLTRISIVDDDDEEVEDANDLKMKGNHDDGLTRIAIVEDDDEGGDENIDLEEAESLKSLGNDAMAQKDFEKAIELYTLSIRRNPSCFASINNRSMAYLQLSLFQEAIKDASHVIDSEEANLMPKALYRRAQAYIGLSSMEEALKDVDRLIALDSTNSAALKLREQILCSDNKTSDDSLELELKKRHAEALNCLSDGKAEDAIEILNKSLLQLESIEAMSGKKNTTRTDSVEDDIYLLTLLLLGRSYSCINDNKNAVATYDRLLGIYPKHFKAYYRRAEAKFNVGDVQAARLDVLSALKIDPVNSEALQLADTISRMEEEKQNVRREEATSRESKYAESERLKVEGNDAMKRAEFQEAIKLYTQAIQLNPSNTAAIGNRAQVYLKVSRFVDAERDASEVLKLVSGNKSSDAVALKVKALFRRGLARRSMGGLANLEKSLKDFKEIVSIESSNKAAAVESTRTEQLIKEMKRCLTNNAAGESSTSLNKGGFMMSELQTTRKPKPKVEEHGDMAIPPSPPPKAAEKKEGEIRNDTKNKGMMKSTTRISPVKVPTVPTEQPKNVYELERIWRGLKTHPQLFAKYITTLKSVTIKKVFNDNVSSDLYSSLFEVCSTFVVQDSPKEAFRVLESLTMMKGFELTASLWPKKDMQYIEEVFTKVSSSGAVPSDKVDAMKRIYFK